jgi:hypothetical protein
VDLSFSIVHCFAFAFADFAIIGVALPYGLCTLYWASVVGFALAIGLCGP